MRSVERPLRVRWAAVLAGLWLAASAVGGAADGTDDGFRTLPDDAGSAALLVPVALAPLDLAAAERIQIEALIGAAAARRGLDGPKLIEIARCESQLNPRITGPGGAAGLFQIIPSTWDWATERLGMPGASPIDPAANVEVAAWLMESYGPGQWPSC
ncbi:MAG TPA: transglycosylase SLT domain-containing protein [Chloroflexota bacterium]|nr:transglycosylase SLT domain-containing protein [Chloroflexota bacterium]